MKYLLDTHVLLWWADEFRRLSPLSLSVLQNPACELYISLASIWELQIKVMIGKLKTNEPLSILLQKQTQQNGIRLLNIALPHVFGLTSLPPLHRDPFDRILIAQANVENLTIITADAAIMQYPVSVLW